MASSNSRILIVDDEQEFALTIKRHLKRHGFQADIAGDGKQACLLIEYAAQTQNHYDVVMTDVVMPLMNGLNLLQWIKKKHPQLPVLVVTGYGAIPNVRAEIRPGWDFIVKKPPKFDVILKLIHSRTATRLSNTPAAHPADLLKLQSLQG